MNNVVRQSGSSSWRELRREYGRAKEYFNRIDPTYSCITQYQKGFSGNGSPWHTYFTGRSTPQRIASLTPEQRTKRMAYAICVLRDERGGNSCRSDIYEAVTALAEAGGLRSRTVRTLLDKRLEQIKREEIPKHYEDMKGFVDMCMEATKVQN